MSSAQSTTKLGFIEDVDNRLLNSHFFPSKVGGRPAWLSLNPIPDSVDLQCSECKEITCFLLQVYSPLQIRDDCFHRTIFVFICKNPSCSSTQDVSKSFKVFRSQLPRCNDFYSSLPPNENLKDDFDIDDFPNAWNFNSLCLVCGIKGPKKCSQCKKASYCGRSHQIIDWKACHKSECKQIQETNTSNSNVKNFFSQRSDPLPTAYEKEIFEEFDLVTEDEVLPVKQEDTNNSKTNEESLKEFENLRVGESSSNKSFSVADLEQTAKAETEDDREFLKFKERIRPEPTQVLRYNRNVSPLWVSAYQKPEQGDIPNCSKCGARRVFEFQIMPQILNHLKLDSTEASVDWGTLCVYTCELSCPIGNGYAPEFIWKQDFHNSSI